MSEALLATLAPLNRAKQILLGNMGNAGNKAADVPMMRQFRTEFL